jgi:hypothetical protein
LRDEFFLAREPGELAHFVNIVRQRFLDVNVFAQLHRGHGNRRVHVIGRGNIQRIEFLLLFQQLAPVLINARFGKLFPHWRGLRGVHVGDGDQLHIRMTRDPLEIAARLPARANGRVQNGLRRRRGQGVAGEKRRRQSGQSGLAQKIAAREASHDLTWPAVRGDKDS